MPGKFGTNRVGWNQRGPTDAMLLKQARERSEPDSYYWKNLTRHIKNTLIERMGEEEFKAFAELLFPGDSICQYTWKQIHDSYVAKLERLAAEELEAESRSWLNDARHYKMRGE